MDKIYINPFSTVMKKKNQIIIYAPPKNEEIVPHLTIEMTSAVEDLLLDIRNKESLNEAFLKTIFSDKEMDFLRRNNILVPSLPDTASFFSRTFAFYHQYIPELSKAKLKSTHIIILGCGGIGSTLAWQLVSLGVINITLLDFDIVDNSNLNRMPLFSCEDIGKKKCEVLQKKLKGLNSEANIRSIDLKIISEDQLYNLLSEGDYDIIVKAVDSPSTFPIWLDEVVKKLEIKYITGITFRDKIMVGPTYIPGKAEVGWSDIVKSDDIEEKISGTVPSLGFALTAIVDELSMEILKLIVGNYDNLSFAKKICCQDIVTGKKSEFIRKKDYFEMEHLEGKGIPTLNVIGIFMSGLITVYYNDFMIACVVLMLLLPFVSYSYRKHILLQTIINGSIVSIFATRILVTVFRGSSDKINLLEGILLYFPVFSVLTLIGCGVALIIMALIKCIFLKDKTHYNGSL